MLTNYLPLNFRLADTRVLGTSRKSISLIVLWRMCLLSSGSMDRDLKFRVWKEDLLSGQRRNRQLDAAYLLIWSQVWWREKKNLMQNWRDQVSLVNLYSHKAYSCAWNLVLLCWMISSYLQPKINTINILDGRILCCVGAVLCIVRCLATSPASPSNPSHDNQNCLQTLANISWGQSSPHGLRAIALDQGFPTSKI